MRWEMNGAVRHGKKAKQNKYHTESIFLPKPCISLIYGARYDRKIARMAYFYITHTKNIYIVLHTHTHSLVRTLSLSLWIGSHHTLVLQHFSRSHLWKYGEHLCTLWESKRRKEMRGKQEKERKKSTSHIYKIHKIAGIETQPEI